MTKRSKRRREAILDFIKEYDRLNGFPPSVSEIADEVGTVKSNAFFHLMQLEEEGLLRHTPGKARSWALR